MKNLVAVLLCLLPLPALAGECYKTCKVDDSGVQLIQFFEGFSPFVYADAGGLPTIGYGHLIKRGEHIPQPLLGQAADDLMRADLLGVERGLNGALLLPLRQGQFNALGSFAFNVGVGACKSSTLLRYTNAGNWAASQQQFYRWVYVDGGKNKGLVARRAAEAKVYGQ